MGAYKIFVADWRPTLTNELFSLHWSKASKRKKADAMMLMVHCSHIPKAETKRIVKVKIYINGSGRTPDPDAPLKSLLDALVKIGMLKDDSQKWVEIFPVEYVRGALTAGTEILLQDIPQYPPMVCDGVPPPYSAQCTKNVYLPEEL